MNSQADIQNEIITEDKAERKQERTGVLCVVAAGILWGIIGLFTNQLSKSGFTSIQITESRCIVATVILGIVLFIKNPGLFRISIKDLWMFIGTGLISIGIFNVCYFQCIKETTLSVACVLLYTGPCFVVLLSAILFHEKIGRQKLICLLVAFLGCVFVSGIFEQGNVKMTVSGFLLGIGSGFFYGLYSIFGHYALKKYDTFTVTFYTFFVAAVGLLPICKVQDMFSGYLAMPGCIGIALMLGLFSTTMPFLFYTKGLEILEAGKASLFAFLEPMTATIISVFVLREGLTWFSGIGIFMIMAAAFCMNIRFQKLKNA